MKAVSSLRRGPLLPRLNIRVVPLPCFAGLPFYRALSGPPRGLEPTDCRNMLEGWVLDYGAAPVWFF
jgi:hypothetical protein